MRSLFLISTWFFLMVATTRLDKFFSFQTDTLNFGKDPQGEEHRIVSTGSIQWAMKYLPFAHVSR